MSGNTLAHERTVTGTRSIAGSARAAVRESGLGAFGRRAGGGARGGVTDGAGSGGYWRRLGARASGGWVRSGIEGRVDVSNGLGFSSRVLYSDHKHFTRSELDRMSPVMFLVVRFCVYYIGIFRFWSRIRFA